MTEEVKGEVFVIQPIGQEDEPVRKRADTITEYIITPVAKDVGLRVPVGRSDRDPTPGPITSKLLRSILDARVVVADLTGRNPNVFYELCFAHSFGKPVVILIDKAENLPFDVKNERVIPLGNRHGEGVIGVEEAEVAKRKLREAFRVVLREDYMPASLVTEVASVQNIENMTPENPIATELAALKRRMDQIIAYVSAQRPSDDMYKRADLITLMSLIERLAGEGKIASDDMNLITDETSTRFDEWVRETRRAYFPEVEYEDLEDIPF
jgi:hypothetical protein